MGEDQHQRVEQIASAIEDLLLMGVIKLKEGQYEKALLSPQFSQVVSNILTDMKIHSGSADDQVMKMMYYSLLIYMTEYLRVPRNLMLALGNDMERNRDNMECGELVTTYVSVLGKIWLQENKGRQQTDN